MDVALIGTEAGQISDFDPDASAPKRVLWFDDQAGDRLGKYLVNRALSDGLEILPASVETRELAFTSIDSGVLHEVVLAIIDWHLELDDLDGIELAQRLLQRWRGPLLFLTRFPRSGAIRKSIDPRIPYRECVKPDSYEDSDLERWYKEEFRPMAHRLVAVPFVDRPGAIENAEAERFFSLTASECASIDVPEFLTRKRHAADAVSDVVRDMFLSTRAPWIVVVGWPLAVVAVGDPGSDPPDLEFLLEIERAWQQDPVVFLRPATINSLVTADGTDEPPDVEDCHAGGKSEGLPDGKADWFPVAQLDIKNRSYDFHFDTGAEMSFLGYEFLRREEVAPRLEHRLEWQPLLLRVGLASSASVLVHAWRVKARCPSRDGRLEAVLRLYLVLEFDASNLTLRCTEGLCPLASANADDYDGYCRYRRGLIGRDVLLQSDWTAVVNATARRVFFLSPDEFSVLLGAAEVPKKGRRRWRQG